MAAHQVALKLHTFFSEMAADPVALKLHTFFFFQMVALAIFSEMAAHQVALKLHTVFFPIGPRCWWH